MKIYMINKITKNINISSNPFIYLKLVVPKLALPMIIVFILRKSILNSCQSIPMGTHKKPVFSVPIGSVSPLPLTMIRFTKSGSKGRFFKSCIQVRLIPHGIHSENRCTFSAFFSVNSRYRRRCHTSEMPQDHGRNIHQMA